MKKQLRYVLRSKGINPFQTPKTLGAILVFSQWFCLFACIPLPSQSDVLVIMCTMLAASLFVCFMAMAQAIPLVPTVSITADTEDSTTAFFPSRPAWSVRPFVQGCHGTNSRRYDGVATVANISLSISVPVSGSSHYHSNPFASFNTL